VLAVQGHAKKVFRRQVLEPWHTMSSSCGLLTDPTVNVKHLVARLEQGLFGTLRL
jgi:hypothetical protein